MNPCKNCFNFATQGNDLCLECALYDEKLRATAVPMIKHTMTLDEARHALGLHTLPPHLLDQYMRQILIAPANVPAKVDDPTKDDYIETEWDLL